MDQKLQSHHFTDADGNPNGGQTFAPGLTIAWQRGPLVKDGERKEPCGCFVETVISAAVDRLQHYQTTKFESEWNRQAIWYLNNALVALQARTAERKEKGVEGTHQVD